MGVCTENGARPCILLRMLGLSYFRPWMLYPQDSESVAFRSWWKLLGCSQGFAGRVLEDNGLRGWIGVTSYTQ